MSSQAAGGGQKVDLGKNAPTTSEGPGPVASDSLAAGSQAFSEGNPSSTSSSSDKPQDGPQSTHTYANAASSGGGTGSGTGTNASTGSHAGTAPSYIENQLHSGSTGGPHGKNITEDDSIGTEDKSKNASFTEFGTKNDPGLAAENKFVQTNELSGAASGGRDKEVDGKTPYDALNAETEA